jgi:hypothetical protein
VTRLPLSPTPGNKLRHLILDDVAKAKVARIKAYAEAHHYVPGPRAVTPGDDPNYWAMFDDYKVVFSITESDGTQWRDLSMSVPGGKYPHPIAVFSMCELFGFTGWDGKSMEIPPSWMGKAERKPVKHVRIVQICGRPN